MILFLTAALGFARNLALSLLPKPKAPPRSPHWPGKEKEALARDGHRCRWCKRDSSKVRLIVHHILPFHLFPQLELVLSNLITLCQPLGGGCHLAGGHTDKKGRRGWSYYNPDVVADAARATSPAV